MYLFIVVRINEVECYIINTKTLFTWYVIGKTISTRLYRSAHECTDPLGIKSR